MASNYKDYLAANVLNDGLMVSYRSLSRDLKVHSNKAKEMLYDFHSTQNARKAGTVHATYIVTGVRKPDETPKTNGTSHQQDHDDVEMDDGAFMSSSAPQPEEEEEEAVAESIKVTTFTLAKEEDLQSVRDAYEVITSIHIYSLQAGTLNNLHAVTECNRKVATRSFSENPLETWKQYGTIHNPNAKRRQGLGQPPPPPAPISGSSGTKQPEKPSALFSTVKSDSRPSSSHSASSEKKQEAAKKAEVKAPSLKREGSSIMAAFEKGKNSTKSSTKTAKKEAPEDHPMLDADDEDEEDEAADEPEEESEEAKQQAEERRKARQDRADQLRQMMEDDDEDLKMEDEDDTELPPPPEPAAAEPKEQEQEQSTVSNGRRRGRRKVMKKKTTKDAEGYIISKEEPVWESFSEEDKPVKAPTRSSNTAKPSLSTAKKAQGNIMNFFGKK